MSPNCERDATVAPFPQEAHVSGAPCHSSPDIPGKCGAIARTQADWLPNRVPLRAGWRRGWRGGAGTQRRVMPEDAG